MSMFMDPNNFCVVVNELISPDYHGKTKPKPKTKTEEVFKDCMAFGETKMGEKKVD